MSSKLTSHFRGTKSDRRSSTGKGKGKVVEPIYASTPLYEEPAPIYEEPIYK